jgi:hypothetical protein
MNISDETYKCITDAISLELGDSIASLNSKKHVDWLMNLDAFISYDPIEVALDLNARRLPLIKHAFNHDKGLKGIVLLMTVLELHTFERHRISKRITCVEPIMIDGRQYGIVIFMREPRFPARPSFCSTLERGLCPTGKVDLERGLCPTGKVDLERG